MNKAVKIIITESLIFVLLFAAGFTADSFLLMNTGNDPEIAGHPAPVFTYMLPIFGAVVIVIIDVIMLAVRIFKKVKHSRAERLDDKTDKNQGKLVR